MDKLIQTKICSIVYGDFEGKPNQELFRCPRELDNVDLYEYINSNRCMFGLEHISGMKNLKEPENYLGYYRLYFRNHNWYGNWIEESDRIDRVTCHGVDNIVEWLRDNFPNGCNDVMKTYLSQYPETGRQRYLFRPKMSDHYIIMFDTTYGNADYPVRIYVYE